MRRVTFSILLLQIVIGVSIRLPAQSQSSNGNIYHGAWIDLNKNGRMDVYEDAKADIDLRISDLLSQMNLEEKTCQTATLYGFARVLKDELPTPEWKVRIWKDGIANIDEL